MLSDPLAEVKVGLSILSSNLKNALAQTGPKIEASKGD